MSLYIRTKMFQILEVTKKEEDTSYKDVCYWYKCKHNRYRVHSDFVFKESDNLEDLCDCFVVISEENEKPILKDKLIDTNAFDFKNHWKPYGNGKVLDKYCQKLIDAEIYGAIWTYEGLKYVAKMNKYGELELI